MANDLDLGAPQSGQDEAGRTPEQRAGLRKEAKHQAAVARLVGSLRDPKRPQSRLSDAWKPKRGKP